MATISLQALLDMLAEITHAPIPTVLVPRCQYLEVDETPYFRIYPLLEGLLPLLRIGGAPLNLRKQAVYSYRGLLWIQGGLIFFPRQCEFSAEGSS